jgi:hypothetical protein
MASMIVASCMTRSCHQQPIRFKPNFGNLFWRGS